MPSIDERIEALTISLEGLTADVHGLQDAIRTMQEVQRRADERERKLRQALMIGIAGFFKALEDGGDFTPPA